MTSKMLVIVAATIQKEIQEAARERDGQFNCLRIARAAIEAMRDPNADMMKAAERSLDQNTIGRPKGITDTWREMIDAALGKVDA